ncbi:helix-turn-helix domain-containing protein [Iodobacter fluviatilis]|uniref:Helix-turn-helix protein n=1 Tax=Iodobacter fluviatilis TaxID=537 RepID=A0A377SW34_9NEIS|nr:helix-turn-helix transcriptional regulator [Iodobacter fluviatilis]TCU81337.1 helix-turn-helix protein [Iodobacter fluviatilis]STR45193.1 Predicted transcriptional regulator [Iodobacter fluviatilis]
MQKTIYTTEYAAFLEALRRAREQSGLTQIEFAARLNVTQSFVSKCERGERRLDIVELRHWCTALGITLIQFSSTYDEMCKK